MSRIRKENLKELIGLKISFFLIYFLNPYGLYIASGFYLKNTFAKIIKDKFSLLLISYLFISALIGYFYTNTILPFKLLITYLTIIILVMQLKKVVFKKVNYRQYTSFLINIFYIAYALQLIDYSTNLFLGEPFITKLVTSSDPEFLRLRLVGSFSFRTGGIMGPNEFPIMVVLTSICYYTKKNLNPIKNIFFYLIIFSSLLMSASLSSTFTFLFLTLIYLFNTLIKLLKNSSTKIKINTNKIIYLIFLIIFIFLVYKVIIIGFDFAQYSRIFSFFTKTDLLNYLQEERTNALVESFSNLNISNHFFGKGIGSWAYDYFQNYGDNDLSNAHNTFAQFYYENGIIGFTLWFSWWIKSFFINYKIIRISELKLFFLFPIIVLLNSMLHNVGLSINCIFFLNIKNTFSFQEYKKNQFVNST